MKLDQSLVDIAAACTHNPTAFVRVAFPWGTGELAGHTGPRAWQAEVLDRIGGLLAGGASRSEAIRVAVASGHGPGKALGHGEPVLTPTGWVPIEEIRLHDLVIAADGTPTEVVGVFPQGERHLYRVTTDDGASVVVDADHQWLTSTRSNRKHNKPATVKTTAEIAASLTFPNGKRDGLNHQLPMLSPVQHQPAPLAIEPYLLGIMLGDGGAGGNITAMDEEMQTVIEAGATLGKVQRKPGNLASTRSVLGIRPAMRTLGLFGCRSHEKFVPPAYLTASIEQRTALLQGLLDSDGYAGPGGFIAFAVTATRLADGAAELVRSLGGVVRRSEKIGKLYGVEHRRVYTLTIALPEGFVPFRIPRKAARYAPSYGHGNKMRTLARRIKSVEPVGVGLATCIAVAHPSQLFVTRDHIVTHNSSLVAWILLWSMATLEDTRGVVTANTDSQLRTKTMAELAKWHRLCLFKDWFDYSATSLVAADPKRAKTWRIDAIPWNDHNPEAFAGLHNQGKRVVIIFDEASSISDKIWQVTEGALTDTNTELIWCAFGNPTRNTGRFRECFRRFRKRWNRWCIDIRKVAGANMEWAKQLVEDYGEDSDIVKVQVRGEFPSQSAKQFIGTDDVDAAFGRVLRPEQYDFAPKVVTVDPAWSGDDALVVGMRQGLFFSVLRTIPKNDNDLEIAGLVASDQDAHGAQVVFIDAGYGTGIVSAGRAMGRNWQLVWFGGKSPDPGYVNMRAYIWGQMKLWLREGGAIEKDQELFDDLVGPETIARMDGRIQLESKEDMKRRGLPSPNKADALALSFAYPVGSVCKAQTKTNSEYDPYA